VSCRHGRTIPEDRCPTCVAEARQERLDASIAEGPWPTIVPVSTWSTTTGYGPERTEYAPTPENVLRVFEMWAAPVIIKLEPFTGEIGLWERTASYWDIWEFAKSLPAWMLPAFLHYHDRHGHGGTRSFVLPNGRHALWCDLREPVRHCHRDTRLERVRS
jgi:hypothetical protein